MSAPPRKPCRRQTFVLEIDPDQILIDLGDACEYHSVGSAVPSSGPLSRDDNTSRRRTAIQDKNDHGGANDDNDDDDDDKQEPDKQSRPPRQPSRRSTVRVGLDPDQLQAFEEWRRLHAAALQDDGGEGGGGECEFSDHNDLSSSVMDLTVDSTILSWVGPCSERGDVEMAAASEPLPTHPPSGGSAPPRQPRRRSTLIVTLGQPQGLSSLGDDNNDEYDEAADGAPPLPMTGHDGGANGASFSEGSHATSVFVELFCRKVLEEQRRQEESTADPGGSPVFRRRRRSRVMPSPRASLRLRGPVRHLRQLMPDLDRIESVGTVLLDDDDEEGSPPSHPRPARGEHPPVQPHRRQSAHTVPAAAAGRPHPTPENSTRRTTNPDLIREDDDDPYSGTDLGGAVARKHDTHPVAPVRALSHQSSPSFGAHDESAPTGIASCDVGGDDEEEVDDVPTTRRDESDDDENDDNNDNDETRPPLGSTVGLASSVAGGTMNKAMRESLQTVATEVSWGSQDDNDDDIDEIDIDEEEEEDGEGGPAAASLEWGGSGPIGSGPSPRRGRPRSVVTCVLHES